MNLYQYYNEPSQLAHYEDVFLTPTFLISNYGISNPSHLFNFRNVFTKDAEYAFWYANNIIEGEFPEGEEVIAKSAEYSLKYARAVLGRRFYKGEEVIKGTEHEEQYQKIINHANRIKKMLADDPLGIL